MGWLTRLLGASGRSPEQVEAELAGALLRLEGVGPVDLAYRTDASGGGSVRGYVEVAAPAAFRAALGVVGRVLGTDGARVAVYLVGRLPDGGEVTPADLGFRSRPSGAELREAQ
ncbi:hypothetical protein INN71_10860 [Nocardioides sp. ChNu-153]|uniref:hypothetical protein n=1 Tax=unclassified Nocardioides TaxID=2615069 RepID=UPI0024067F39|nr:MULTISPECIES: hypothetical protein [unclassified Nocardioides]MDF9715785.1 hypothetical protein [Nocardioides sp. ChNu-99]MDN7121890.1 hypothetical protein [Nocardioides sp. ChNu-153]